MLILFDLDGTLLDTLEDLSAAANHALELRGLPLHTPDEYRRMVGHGVRNLVKQALPPGTDDALVDGALADFKAYYSAHIDVHTRPYPGIPELLEELSAAGLQLAVVSNKFQEGTEHLIRHFFPGVPFAAILGLPLRGGARGLPARRRRGPARHLPHRRQRPRPAPRATKKPRLTVQRTGR